MRNLIFSLCIAMSMNSFAQSLQCQLEREQLVSEYRQKQQSEQQAFDRNQQLARLTPRERNVAMLGGSVDQLGSALAGAMGGQTLEQRIQDWERRCGR